MSFFLKLHVLAKHVPDFLDKQHQKPEFQGYGLGYWNEQCFESVHQDFDGTWENYKADPKSDVYDTQLNKCVYTYNARHI